MDLLMEMFHMIRTNVQIVFHNNDMGCCVSKLNILKSLFINEKVLARNVCFFNTRSVFESVEIVLFKN